MSAALDIANLTVNFGGVAACDDISMTIGPGEIRGLIGPNGAGKTTLFNAVSGLVQTNSGTISFQGRDITGVSAHRRAGLGIRRTFQTTQLLSGLTVLENILIGLHRRISNRPLGGVQDGDAADRVMQVLEYLGVPQTMFRDVDSLAFAERRYVEIARALVAEPAVLLLDEPAAGMAPAEVEDLDRLIMRLSSEQGITILLVEHVISLVMNVCHCITVLDRGRVIAEGTPREISDNRDVRAAYLGEGDHA